MATVTYTFVGRCGGGGHTTLDVSVNGGASRRVIFQTDELREPLSSLTADEQRQFAEMALRVHLAGKTRAQIVTEFGSPVTITI